MSSWFHVETPADEIPFIVIPTDHIKYSLLIGCLSVVIDNTTGEYVYAVVGDGGRPENGFGEVSLKVVWDLGYKNASGYNGPEGDFTIIVYEDTREEWKTGGLYNQIQSAGMKYYR